MFARVLVTIACLIALISVVAQVHTGSSVSVHAADCGTTGATGPSGPSGATGPTGLNTTWGYHSPDRMPPNDWRPHARDGMTSPANLTVASAPSASNSTTRIASMNAVGYPKPINHGWDHPLYWASSTDPTLTIRTGNFNNGATLKAPQGAKPDPNGDGHIGIVQPDGTLWSGGVAAIDWSANSITRGYWRKSRIDGLGFYPESAQGTSNAVTAGDTAAPTMMLRGSELQNGRIDHVLFGTSSDLCSCSVYPARRSDGGRSTSYPATGNIVAWDPAYMTDARLAALPAPQRIVDRALRDHGVMFADSGGSGSSIAIKVEGRETYTAFGRSDPFAAYLSAQGITGGIDWAKGLDRSKLRIIDPAWVQAHVIPVG